MTGTPLARTRSRHADAVVGAGAFGQMSPVKLVLLALVRAVRKEIEWLGRG